MNKPSHLAHVPRDVAQVSHQDQPLFRVPTHSKLGYLFASYHAATLAADSRGPPPFREPRLDIVPSNHLQARGTYTCLHPMQSP